MNNVTANMNIYFEEPKWICEYFRKTETKSKFANYLSTLNHYLAIYINTF